MNLNSIIPWKKDETHLARRDNADPFLRLHDRVNRLFDDFLGQPTTDLWGGSFDGRFAPQIDVKETDKEVRIEAELPGLDRDNVDLTISGNLLTIKGEKKEEQEEDKGDYWHHERSYGYFQRSVQLPEGVDPDKINAKFKNGVLKVSIPKKPEAQSSRRKIELIEG